MRNIEVTFKDGSVDNFKYGWFSESGVYLSVHNDDMETWYIPLNEIKLVWEHKTKRSLLEKLK